MFTKMGSSNSDSPSNSDAMDLINDLMNEKGAVADRKSAISFSDFHAAVQKMVEAEIEKHSADGIGRVDYAVASGGGSFYIILKDITLAISCLCLGERYPEGYFP